MAITIKGEAGKTLNATSRTLKQLNIGSGILRFQSLADDLLTWTAATTNAAGAGTIVPDIGQVVEVHDGATRRFRGHVTKVKPGMKSVTVEAAGPWWWMTRIKLSSTRTDPNGSDSTRAQYVFPTGDLRQMIISLLDRAIDEGVPMERGTGTQIAEMYDWCKVTLSDMSYAAALANFISRVPDAVVWFDYGTGSTLPRLKIARRGGADAMTEMDITYGVDVEDFSIEPRLDLEISRTEIKYMDRHPVTGRPRFQTQGSGTAQTGKLQIVTVSGPEIVDQLPLEDFESYRLKTTTGLDSTWVSKNDSGLAAVRQQYGMIGAIGTSVTTYRASGTTRRPYTSYFPGLKFRKQNGSFVKSLTGKYVVISTDIPDWVVEKYGGMRVTITGTWIAQWRDSVQGMGTGWSKAFQALRVGAETGKGLEKEVTVGEDRLYENEWLARGFEVAGVLINTSFPGEGSDVYKPWDWDFLNPPAGMAGGLRQSQNWVPWEGSITTAHQTVTGANLLPRAMNLLNALPACATMKALNKAVTYDLVRGRRTFQLGAPARIDLGTAMGRVAVAKQDVIEIL